MIAQKDNKLKIKSVYNVNVKDRDFVNTVNIFSLERTMTSLKYYTMTMVTATTRSRKEAAEDEREERERSARACKLQYS